MFAFLYQLFGWCLRFFYNITGSYGWAIVLFSLFSQVLLLPLSLKQAKMMEVQKAIAPETQKLQAKYPHDKERMNEELMKLYKANNFNPMSGCLPLLIQFPIIIGLFGALRQPEIYVFSAGEFAAISKSFLWINDLTMTPVQLFKAGGLSTAALLSAIFPIISIGLTFWQQKMTTAEVDQSQKTMMYFMTAMIAYCSFTFSQGIAIYWTLRTLLGIVQQKLISKKGVEVTVPKKLPKKKKK